MSSPILLNAYAARSCPVKTQNAFDATLQTAAQQTRTQEPDEALTELFDGGLRFEDEVLHEFAMTFTGSLLDFRELAEESSRVRVGACLAAMHQGIDVILGGWLPLDAEGHRSGTPDLLVRGEDRADGTHRYHPVEVKWHKIIERRRSARSQRPTGPLRYSTFADPRPLPGQELAGYGVRVASREGDLIQLAHYHRLLEAAGFADADQTWAAVIGTDDVLGETFLAWTDLSEPTVRTFSRSHAEGWRLRSILDRYDHEHAFRVDVATVAARRTADPRDAQTLLVTPIRTDECRRCQWWEHCRPQLHPDDVSLRIDKGPLDLREIATLRAHGVSTVTELAAADLDTLLEGYLPEVTHRSGAETRLRVAARRARMLLSDTPLDRETTGPIEVPGAEIEIDFDVETSADHRVYLWGFRVNDVVRGTQRYVEFSRFAALDVAEELDLAREALSWLRDLVEGGRSVLVYHYSQYEVAMVTGLRDRSDGDPVLAWAAEYATRTFVDLFDIVKTHFFGVAGLGLKIVAQHGPAFAWRDDDPGGLNSQRWFAEAAHGESPEIRALARQRVLEYNEDDVIATAEVRGWLREQ